MTDRIEVIDTHTGGEPTRVVIAGGPDLGGGSLAERRQVFAQRFDTFRSAVVNEPRGSDVMVGALLVPPTSPEAITGVIFFNNVGTLGMCGHGTIGVAAALAHLGRIAPGNWVLETPVGLVPFEYAAGGRVSFDNVSSDRFQANVPVVLADGSEVRGDVAWGGNWFFLVRVPEVAVSIDRVAELTAWTSEIRRALKQQGTTGRDGAEIDHVEVFGSPADNRNDSRNFVLCPGGAYDRSPCGTGTSAKLACLAADGKLSPGQIWRQESVIGSLFEGRYRQAGNSIVPTITGSAWVNAEATLLLDPTDPFMLGILR